MSTEPLLKHATLDDIDKQLNGWWSFIHFDRRLTQLLTCVCYDRYRLHATVLKSLRAEAESGLPPKQDVIDNLSKTLLKRGGREKQALAENIIGGGSFIGILVVSAHHGTVADAMGWVCVALLLLAVMSKFYFAHEVGKDIHTRNAERDMLDDRNLVSEDAADHISLMGC